VELIGQFYLPVGLLRRPRDGVSLQQLGQHFSKVISSPKNQFQAFWKSHFCKMLPLAELLKLVVAIKVP